MCIYFPTLLLSTLTEGWCSTIYNMCTQKPPHDYSEQLYNRYRDSFIRYIADKVKPPLSIGSCSLAHNSTGLHRTIFGKVDAKEVDQKSLMGAKRAVTGGSGRSSRREGVDAACIRARPDLRGRKQVLPSLQDHRDEFLLQELLTRWSNHKVMVRWLSRFFNYLDRCVKY